MAKVVFILNAQGVYTWVCRNIEVISGYTQEEVVGKSAFDFIHPDDKDRVIQRFSPPLPVDTYVEDSFRVVDKDGSIVKIKSRTIRIPDGSILGEFDHRGQDR
jgi:PAS domain S-box-containing protein